MGCVCLPDALITTFISTSSGVSGEHYDKIEQQQRRAVTYFCTRPEKMHRSLGSRLAQQIVKHVN
jgi:hypothetical protein